MLKSKYIVKEKENMKLIDSFKDRHFWKTTIRLSMPIIIQNLLVSSFSLVDTLMVSQVGQTELAAAGMAGQWSWMLSMMLFGIASGLSIFTAQYWGIKNIKGIHKSLCISIISVLVITLPYFVSGAFFTKAVMKLFTDEAPTFAAGVKYLRIAAFSYPAVALSNIFFSLLRSTENVKLPMYVSMFTTMENCVMNYALIFGKLGMPKMGIEGAAVATCISAWSGPVLMLIISYFQKNMLRFSPKIFLSLKKEDFKTFYTKALPVAANETLWGLGTFAFNVIYSNLGSQYYAALTILRTFEEISFCVFIGMCNACAVMVGKNVGKGDIKAAVKDAKRFALLEPFCALIIGGIFILIRKPLVHLFNLTGNIDKATLDIAVVLIVIFALEMALRNLPYIQIVGLFRAGGEASKAAKFDIFCLWLISLPVTLFNTYILHLPFTVIFALMFICEDIPKSVLCIKYFLSGKWIAPVTEQGKKGLAEYRKTHAKL